jgi:type I restriction-modification system DNA methylase subunit
MRICNVGGAYAVGRAEETVSDPACSTGGFLLAAHDYLVMAFGKKCSATHIYKTNKRNTVAVKVIDNLGNDVMVWEPASVG